ncbi:MAG: EAL domain-containing protein [Lachnospiraceae bacterium]|nr:EAL domain-containing protein [Lachnospiraceae bacterium]
MSLNQGLIYTNDNCIGCNRCISGCPVLGANVAVSINGQNHIHVDGDKCLHCGRCLAACKHNAREYRDDTQEFMERLEQGASISLLVAPSFFIIYGDKASQILGYLKSRGVKLVYDVSYGADIATWAYLSYVEAHKLQGAIAPPCSAIVNYLQKYSKTLTEAIIPIHSPLLCLAVYLRKYRGITDEFAFLSPCIAKKDEIDDPGCEGLVQYNVTFTHLMKVLDNIDVSGYDTQIELSDYGLGRIYPVPGGLSDNIKHFIESYETVRELHGENNVYDYFAKLENRVLLHQELPYLVDCLNCSQGCLSGTATADFPELDDDIYFRLQHNKRPNPLIAADENPYLRELSLEERRARLFRRFEHLKIEDFERNYQSGYSVDDNAEAEASREAQLERIFHRMYKDTEESRRIDCHSCGYSSCREMAKAIAGGYNTIENCVHYLKDENMRVSMIDIRMGIPNLNAYLNFTEKLLVENRVQDYGFLYFNINNFKFVNQKYGFRRGDAALKEYCMTVAELAGKDELVALVGGNNFVGIFKEANLKDILHELEGIPLITLADSNGGQVYLSARVAVYIPDGKDNSPQMIMEKMSTTFAEINRSISQSVLYYDERLRQQKIYEDEIMNSVEPGLQAKEFEVFYQPKVNMKTRKLIGAEALIRWRRNGSIVPPMDFIPICEKVGLVQKLDFYVLDTVCRHIVEWIDKGITMVPISVNFSKQHFVEDTVAEHINKIAEKWKTPKQYLEIEFTETAYLDDGHNLVSSIDKLHEFGISSSMDDFGTGYSSLSMLQNMSFDTLKLDKTFLQEGNDERSRKVIENIIRMAKELNMSIVSEGIETEKELQYMSDMDCDIAQGYLFDKPLTHDEFEKRLIRIYYPLAD